MEKLIFFLIIPVVLDLLLGDPHSFPHPIVYVGKIISFYEKLIRKSKVSLKVGGFMLLALSISTVITILSLLLDFSSKINPTLNLLVIIYLIYTSLASRCLDIEARKVYRSLIEENIEKSRTRLSYLVGRDTSNLTREEITKATIETVAENTIDGVLAPLIFITIGIYLGHPVQFAFFYKTINTLDSMVGYKNEKYENLGYASAKADDLVNYLPARVGSICMLLGGLLLGKDFKNGWKILKRDRRNHKSPNCAYPESVVAGLLGIKLGGTHSYFGKEVYKPSIGDGHRQVAREDIITTIKVMYISELILILLFLLLFLNT